MENKEIKVKEKVEEDKALVMAGMLVEPMSLADVFVKSGCFPDIKSVAAGAVKILAGKEYGLTPIQSITELFIVNGRVAMSAKLIAAAVKKSGKYDYHVDTQTGEECTISFFEIIDGKRQEIGKSTFTIKDAARAGIVNKPVWANYPKNMLFARAISNGGRTFCPDIITAYTPEEVEDVTPMEVKPTTVSIDVSGEVKSGSEA